MIKKIIREEIITFLNEEMDEGRLQNLAAAGMMGLAGLGVGSNLAAQSGMDMTKYSVDVSKPKTELVGTRTATQYWAGRSYEMILNKTLDQGNLKIYGFNEGQQFGRSTLTLTLDSTDVQSVENAITSSVKNKPTKSGGETNWGLMYDSRYKPNDGKGFSMKLSTDKNGRVVLQFNSNHQEPSLIDKDSQKLDLDSFDKL